MPDWKPEIRRRLAPLTLDPARESAVADELAQHLDDHYRELTGSGMPDAAARQTALAGLDRHELLRELKPVAAPMRSQPIVLGAPNASLLAGLWQDVRYSLRVLRKNPGFSAIAVLTLALGIGANTAIFSVINTLFLHPPGISDAARLVTVRVKYDKLNLKNISISLPDYVDARDSKQVFSSVAAVTYNNYNYTGGELPERLMGAQVTWQWFQTLGGKTMLGRAFQPEEDQPAANQVVVLSYSTWKRIFGGDAGIVGKTIPLNDQQYRVVGVAAADFNWPSVAQIWVPLGLPASEYDPQNRFNESYQSVARLAPGVSVAQAEAYVKVLTERVIPQMPDRGGYARSAAWGMFAMPLMELVYGDLRTPMLVLLGAVGFVLLICCANVAGLMLAKASGRVRELAIRTALGARRAHLIRQVLVESLLMAGAGTAVGLGLAVEAVRSARLIAPDETIRNLSIPLDGYVLLFSIGVGLLCALLFGLAPAWSIAGSRSFESLKEGGRSATVGRARQRLRSVLVVGEVALALVLLVGAGLFLKSLMRLQEVNPGFDAHGVMTAAVSLSPRAYASAAKQQAFYDAAAARLAAQPGVEAAGFAVGMPFSQLTGSSSFSIEGQQLGPGDPGPHSDNLYATAGFFRAFSIPLRKGRYFTDQDRAGSEPVAMIDETLAATYWPNEDPIGRRIRRGRGAQWARIVGVVGHTNRSALAGDSGKGVSYYPLLQSSGDTTAHLVARAAAGADPRSLATAMRESVKAVDPSQATVYDLQPMSERLSTSLGPRRFAVTLLSTFASIALFMAALGLYGVISYAVVQRTQEIGIRMALGARMAQVLGMVVAQGLRLVLAGVALGLVAALVLVRLLRSELVQISAFDPVTFIGMSALLVLVGVAATYLPARRAAKVDPMVALRYE